MRDNSIEPQMSKIGRANRTKVYPSVPVSASSIYQGNHILPGQSRLGAAVLVQFLIY